MRVSSQTITSLTSGASMIAPDKVPPQPGKDELIDSIRQALIERARKTALRAKDASKKQDEDLAGEFNRVASLAEFHVKRFEWMLDNVPEGFELVPVLYTKNAPTQNTRVRDEYALRVRPAFLRYLADNYTHELKALGICDHGIDRMKKGLDPADKSLLLYKTNIDHIVELSGSGDWSRQKVKDPDNTMIASGVSPVNHFGNMMFMPEKVHNFKNALNSLQYTDNMKEGESKWMLMMVPVRDAAHSGFVCPPQPKGHHLHGVNFRKRDMKQIFAHIHYVVDNALTALDELKKDKLVAAMITTFEEVAARQQKTVANMVAEQSFDLTVKNNRELAVIFNDLAAYVPDIREHLDLLVRPKISDVTSFLSALDKELSTRDMAQGKNKHNYHRFACFFNGTAVRQIRRNIDSLPMEEAAASSRVFIIIDQHVKDFFNAHNITTDCPPQAAHAREPRTRRYPPRKKPGA